MCGVNSHLQATASAWSRKGGWAHACVLGVLVGQATGFGLLRVELEADETAVRTPSSLPMSCEHDTEQRVHTALEIGPV